MKYGILPFPETKGIVYFNSDVLQFTPLSHNMF